MLCYMLSGYQKMIQVLWSCARWCPVYLLSYTGSTLMSSLFDYLFNGDPHKLLPLSLNFLTPSAVSASLNITTRHYHAFFFFFASTWKDPEQLWHLCHIRPEPGKFCLHQNNASPVANQRR